jgi:quercetin dioxygenase-like cupin family protein
MNEIQIAKLGSMTKGWFVGNFQPTLYQTSEVEVGVKTYKAGDYDELHHHKVATEITVLIRGRARIGGIEIVAGDIVLIPPNQAVDFLVLEDSETVVVKLPGASNDKYLGSI